MGQKAVHKGAKKRVPKGTAVRTKEAKFGSLTIQMKQKKMLAALTKHMGVVTFAMKELGIPRVKHYEMMHEHPEYAAEVAKLGEIAIDFAEKALHKQVKEGIPVSTMFLLRTLGKRRGYTEKLDVEHSGNLSINISFEEAKPGDVQ